MGLFKGSIFHFYTYMIVMVMGSEKVINTCLKLNR